MGQDRELAACLSLHLGQHHTARRATSRSTGLVQIVTDREELQQIDSLYRAKYVDPGSGAQATIFEPEADLYRVNVRRVMAWEYATVQTARTGSFRDGKAARFSRR